MDLIARIRAEIDKDVEIVNGEDWHAQEERYWPDRVERQAAAFRKILGLAQEAIEGYEEDPCNGARQIERAWASDVIGALADVYGLEHT